MRKKVVFHWSGGKDSALCLYKVLHDSRYDVKYLLTSVSLEHKRISMHGVHESLLDKQAELIGIPLIKMYLPESVGMEQYEDCLSRELLKLEDQGIKTSIFGDIFLQDLKAYRESFMEKHGLSCEFPLWGQSTKELVQEFISLKFKTVLTAVNGILLDSSFVGRVIDTDFLNDLPDNVDPAGENGEFHTFVFDGPLFSTPLNIELGKLSKHQYKIKTESEETNPVFYFRDLILKS